MNRLLFFFLLLLLIAPGIAVAGTIPLNLEYPSFGGIDLKTDQSLETFIAWLYYAVISISGIAAFIMLVWGGIQWMSSVGDPARTGDAKDRIQKALLGLLLVLSSFIIIQIINPELTILKAPILPSSTSPSLDLGEEDADLHIGI